MWDLEKNKNNSKSEIFKTASTQEGIGEIRVISGRLLLIMIVRQM